MVSLYVFRLMLPSCHCRSFSAAAVATVAPNVINKIPQETNNFSIIYASLFLNPALYHLIHPSIHPPISHRHRVGEGMFQWPQQALHNIIKLFYLPPTCILKRGTCRYRFHSRPALPLFSVFSLGVVVLVAAGVASSCVTATE